MCRFNIFLLVTATLCSCLTNLKVFFRGTIYPSAEVLRLVPSWFLDVVIHSLGPQLADSVTALRIMETKGAI